MDDYEDLPGGVDDGAGDEGSDGTGSVAPAPDPAPRINGGLLDPGAFPVSLLPPTQAVKVGPVVQPQPQTLTGPLMTDPHAEVLQDILNAQAGLPPVKPHPETWSVNGRPYLAIAADFDPSQSSHVTAMPTPADSAAAFAGRSRVAVHDGNEERGGYIGHSPSRVLRLQGRAGDGGAYDTFTYDAPVGYPRIHGHIDTGEHASEGFVDNASQAGGFGDSYSLSRPQPEPNATVSHGQVGWHVLDNGQLKFLYPAGSMGPSQIQLMQNNLDQEQKNLSGSKR